MPKCKKQIDYENREWENFVLSEQMSRLYRMANYKESNKFSKIIKEMEKVQKENWEKNKHIIFFE